mgnify:CR=1 FL=1|jgi:uncharacterized protein YecE (DUF72 family)
MMTMGQQSLFAKQNFTDSKICIGTSGYAYPDWKGQFYPAKLSNSKMLDYYAEIFDFCELNFSYYKMPSYQQMKRYTEYPLTFSVKVPKEITHSRVDTSDVWEQFEEAIQPIVESNQLSMIVLQFPFSFQLNDINRAYLSYLTKRNQHLPLAVEFRNPAWQEEKEFSVLRNNGVTLIATDAPAVNGGMAPLTSVTSESAYIRLHGRNSKEWWTGDNVSRYAHDYQKEELGEWIPRIEEMAKKTKKVYVAFNNHAGGKAPKNAIQLKKMLDNIRLMLEE